MSRTKIITTSELVHSNEYKSVSLEGRDLYIFLLTETDGGGKICDPEFYTKGCGYDIDTLYELYDAGLLLKIDNETFVTNFWEANTKRAQFVKITTSTKAWKSGKLGFEDEEFKSKFVLVDASTEQVPNNYGTSTEQCMKQGTDQSNATATSSATSSASATFNANCETENETRACTCDWCNSDAVYAEDGNGGYVIYCPNCGTHVFGEKPPEILDADIRFGV